MVLALMTTPMSAHSDDPGRVRPSTGTVSELRTAVADAADSFVEHLD
jgi:hypothetical protein